MQIINKIFYTFLSLLCLSFFITSCNKSDKIELKNEGTIYMPQAADSRGLLSLRLADTPQIVVFGAAYGGLKYPGQDINVSFKLDTMLINSYNALNGTSYIAMPATSYTISGLQSVIKAGQTSSNPLQLAISTKMLHFGTHYMLPISLTSNSSGTVDSSMRTTYFAVDTITRLSIDFTGLAALTVSHESNPPDANEGSLKLVDGDYTTKFFTSGYSTDFWMQQAFKTAVAVGAYTLTSGNDATRRDPKDWNLAGSNDGNTWTVLDTRTGEIFSDRNQTRRFEVDDTTPYTYYRVYITQNGGSPNFQLSEWRLIKYE